MEPSPLGATPSPTTDPLLLQNQVCFALSVASRSVIGSYKEVLEPLGLTHPQYLVMLALWEESPRSLKNLASVLHQEPATLSPLVKRLESQGHVSRTRSEADVRVLHVALTDAGRALREDATQVPQIMMRRLGLTEDQFVELHRVLTGLLSGLRENDQLL